MRPILRPAGPGDLDALSSIEAAWPTTPHWSRAQFEEELGRLVVAEADGRVAGYAGLSILPPDAQVATIAVRPELARQGLGRLLLRALMDKARALGCARAQLEVGAGNVPALRLYESEGFRVVGRRPKYYNDGSDALLMDKDL